ncbi:MAG: three-Cys-motif partner protein TcmP [Deltaproteobacteria bacterium]|nr:three-Cys-motif partner protein TcmP [Deltaproteobacteria bacterium]
MSKSGKTRGPRHAKTHVFGGSWTDEKLELLSGYLKAYTTALKGNPSKPRHFITGYIDAFAGTGSRAATREPYAPQGAFDFPDLALPDAQHLLDGSARLALRTEPRFDRYIFIERSPDRCADLEGLKAEFPDLAKDILIRQGDANAELQDLCSKDWRTRRAVLFLDPYGMQVDWKTIEAIAATKAIDLWLLFPLGIGVNRLLTKSGDIPASWRRRLDLLLGTDDWYEEFHRVERQPGLFGDVEHVEKATLETIGRYFNERLASIFAAVAPQPRVLKNSANNPMYLFCFAAANERGAKIALKIANHLLTKGV